MVAVYKVAGMSVGSHWLSIATLATTFGLAFGYPYLSGGGQKKAPMPPINASSKDEETFIQEFLQSVEQEDKKGKEGGKAAH